METLLFSLKETQQILNSAEDMAKLKDKACV